MNFSSFNPFNDRTIFYKNQKQTWITTNSKLTSSLNSKEEDITMKSVKPSNENLKNTSFQQLRNVKSKPPVLFNNPPVHKNKQQIQKIQKIVEDCLSDNIDMKELCRKLGMSYSALYRLLKIMNNQTPSVFIRTCRLKKAQYLLKNTNLSISDIAYEVGFKDPNYFSRIFKETFGVTASEMRR